MTTDIHNPLLGLHQASETLETLAYGPVEIVSTFGEPQAEYAAVRKSVGLIDLPQVGFIELTGKDRHAFLNNLLSNQTYDKAAKQPLKSGESVYAFLLNLKGRVVCDLWVIESTDRTLLAVDVRLIDTLIVLLNRYLFADDVRVRSLVNETHAMALHGPRAVELCDAEIINGRIIGAAVVTWRDDVCGVPGVHIAVATSSAEAVWSHLVSRHGGEIELGKRLLRPIGWAAFNATRIENGRGLFGIDFELAAPSMPGAKPGPDEPARAPGVLPAETGLLDQAVSFTKGCYLGQEIVARMHARKQVARLLVGLRVDAGALPIAGEHVIDASDNPIGVITSSTMSPMLSDAAIALAIVKKPHFEIGTVVRVPAEGAMRNATVVATPFIPRSPAI